MSMLAKYPQMPFWTPLVNRSRIIIVLLADRTLYKRFFMAKAITFNTGATPVSEATLSTPPGMLAIAQGTNRPTAIADLRLRNSP
jgi:hypothetical protein